MKTAITMLIMLTGFLFSFSNKEISGSDLAQRKTVETIDYARGIVRNTGSGGIFMIECAERHLKLRVINMPSEYREADLPVVFSGNIKMTNPLEDEDGEYFEVKTIH